MSTPVPSERRFVRLAAIGWILWLASLVTPDVDFSGIGIVVLPEALFFGLAFIVHPDDMSSVAIGAALLVGVIANLSIFLWLPRWACVVAIVATLIPFIALLAVVYPNWSRAFGLLMFYPWAVGIGLIQTARILTYPFPRYPGEARRRH